MSSPQNRTPARRILASGTVALALLLGPAAGGASASDRSILTTISERGEQIAKREALLAKDLKALQRTPSSSRVTSAEKSAAAIHRTTVAFRDEIREDDGSTDDGTRIRDAVLPEITAMAEAAKKLETTLEAAQRRRVTKAQVTKIVKVKKALDTAIGSALATIVIALEDDGPADPAPAPTDPTV